MADFLSFLAGVVGGSVGTFFVYRNNVKTANQLAADATKALANAKIELGQLRLDAQKAGIKL